MRRASIATSWIETTSEIRRKQFGKNTFQLSGKSQLVVIFRHFHEEGSVAAASTDCWKFSQKDLTNNLSQASLVFQVLKICICIWRDFEKDC